MSRLSPHRIGETIAGRYRLISPLGEGGFGVAYRAWDEEAGVPIVLKMPLAKHLVRPVIIERFEREVVRLRQCSHPNIVPILDDGRDDQGRPFLVMRFLPGGSLADRKKPAGPAVLHRWLPAVASALDYTHGQGVLHRDVKPANIFFDTQARAFLGDFGIAKLVDEQVDDRIDDSAPVAESYQAGHEREDSLTQTRQFIGTRPYAPPEAFDDRPRLTPQADQYSLAVAVYEMLCGKWPAVGTEQELRDFHASRQRPASLAHRMKNLPASLVTAVDKALGKRPEDRFATCQSFAAAALADVQFTPVDPSHYRFLCPACHRLVRVPHDFGGRSCRCPDCNAVLRVSPSLDALWRREESLSAVTERVNPGRASPAPPSVGAGLPGKVMLSSAGESLPRLARLEARAMQLKEQGLYAESVSLYEELLLENETLTGRCSSEAVRLRAELGSLYKLQRRYDAAVDQYTQVLRLQEVLFGDGNPESISTLLALGALYGVLKDVVGARFACTRAQSLHEQSLGPEHPAVARTLISIGTIHRSMGDLDTAKSMCSRALGICMEAYGPTHNDTAAAFANLGAICRLQQLNSEADLLLACAQGIRALPKTGHRSSRSSDDVSGLATQLNNLAVLCHRQSEYDRAEVLFKHAIALWEGTSRSNAGIAMIYENAAMTLVCLGRSGDAETLYGRALVIREETQGSEHGDTVETLLLLAGVRRSRQKCADAETLYKRALSIREKQLGAEHQDTAIVLSDLAAFLLEQHRYEESERLYKRALAIRENVNHEQTAAALANLAMLYCLQGRRDEAEPLYKRALALREKARDHEQTAASLAQLAALYYAQRRFDDAEPLYRRALTIRENLLGLDHVETARARVHLARNSWKQGKYSTAKHLLALGLHTLDKVLGRDHPEPCAVRHDFATMQRERDADPHGQ